MKSWKLPPNNASIAKYVECYWYLEKESSDLSHAYPKLYPDPSTHLVIANSEHPYAYSYESVIQDGHGCHWISPHLKTFTMDHSGPFQIIGVKFNVGAMYALCALPRLPVDLVQNADIDQLLGLNPSLVEECFREASQQPFRLCEYLDLRLAAYLDQIDFCEDTHSALVRGILALLETRSISQIGSELQCSQRTAERSFIKVTGLTMKQTQTMLSLEEMLEYLHERTGEVFSWADVAADFGFSDQAHLIRSLKKQIGQTPGEYAQQRDLTIDVYGNFEFT